jgi:hypothetical protein
LILTSPGLVKSNIISLNYLAFQSFDFERHLMKVILKTHVHTKFDIYDVFIMKLVFAASLLSMQHFLGL